MLFTVKEMEALCVFHAGSLQATLTSMRNAVAGATEPYARPDDIRSVIDKLSGMREGDIAFIAFEPDK
jgi:hypothetical protein